MDAVECVIYFQSAVIFLSIAFVVVIIVKMYSGRIIVKHKDSRNQVDPERVSTIKLPQENPDQEAGNARLLAVITHELKLERSRVAFLTAEFSREKQEKEDALKRLSAIMSSRLRDGNPNVVDLSDQNRPIKVGERFSELYDNQWTDAFSALETFFGDSKQEPELISVLLNILQQCFAICKDKANNQLTVITATITKKSSKLSADLMQRIKEERKLFASELPIECDEVLTTLPECVSSGGEDKRFLEHDIMKLFIQECLKLSWLMVIQDPPMTIVMEPLAKEYENFKAYKTRGKYLAFVVWPALLLEEGGPLIMKGIAEFDDVSTISEHL